MIKVKRTYAKHGKFYVDTDEQDGVLYTSIKIYSELYNAIYNRTPYLVECAQCGEDYDDYFPDIDANFCCPKCCDIAKSSKKYNYWEAARQEIMVEEDRRLFAAIDEAAQMFNDGNVRHEQIPVARNANAGFIIAPQNFVIQPRPAAAHYWQPIDWEWQPRRAEAAADVQAMYGINLEEEARLMVAEDAAFVDAAARQQEQPRPAMHQEGDNAVEVGDAPNENGDIFPPRNVR